MNSKDKNTTKSKLMDELKSIKGILDEGDDNIPLLLGDEEKLPDFPDEDDDIPVLTAPEDSELSRNKASLEAALRQLESMELAPKAKPIPSLEDTIRNNAAPPRVSDDQKKTMVRPNPFAADSSRGRFEESRKLAEDALKSVVSQSKAHVAAPAPVPKTPTPAFAESEEDGSEDILKLLEEEPELELDLDDDDLGDDLDDLDALLAEEPAPKKTPAAKASAPVTGKTTQTRPSDAELNKIVDEIVEEYLVILEVALKKKLKEKLPNILK